MTSQITYTSYSGVAHTIRIGRVYGVRREGDCEDICLERKLAVDCPLTITILIRTTGEIVLLGTAWSESNNGYWHFGAGDADQAKFRHPTPGQLNTLERMFLGLAELPANLGGALGAPVAAWAFAGQTHIDIAAKHGVAAPAMNR